MQLTRNHTPVSYRAPAEQGEVDPRRKREGGKRENLTHKTGDVN